MKVLFAGAEVAPLVKTGGLADVLGSLPAELARLGHDVRLAVPAYPAARAGVPDARPVARMRGRGLGRLLRGSLPPAGEVPLYLVEAPALLDRPGSPYTDERGEGWPDNHRRFDALARGVLALAAGADDGWRPDVVHCHDWHTGLVPLHRGAGARPSLVFTVHNLAYQGLFPRRALRDLHLDPALWSADGVEFWGQVSFMKAGLTFSDWLTTVSPTYAREICTPVQGCGLDGVLRRRADRLVGILNGVDYGAWDPAGDGVLAAPYVELAGKAPNKAALQRELRLGPAPRRPLFAFLSRLVEQKGIELIVAAAHDLLRRDLQLAFVGDGEARFAEALRDLEAAYPGRLAFRPYDEALAHRLLGGADALLMPSRFEPCGLTQLYALRYGTVPIVRRTGGLADTVLRVDPLTLHDGVATGFQFLVPSAESLVLAVDRALDLYARPDAWARVVAAGMAQDFGWARSARRYLDLYEVATTAPRASAPPASRTRSRARA